MNAVVRKEGQFHFGSGLLNRNRLLKSWLGYGRIDYACFLHNLIEKRRKKKKGGASNRRMHAHILPNYNTIQYKKSSSCPRYPIPSHWRENSTLECRKHRTQQDDPGASGHESAAWTRGVVLLGTRRGGGGSGVLGIGLS